MIETDVFVKTIKEGKPELYAKYEEVVNDLLAGKIDVGTAVGATTEYVEAEKAKADPSAN